MKRWSRNFLNLFASAAVAARALQFSSSSLTNFTQTPTSANIIRTSFFVHQKRFQIFLSEMKEVRRQSDLIPWTYLTFFKDLRRLKVHQIDARIDNQWSTQSAHDVQVVICDSAVDCNRHVACLLISAAYFSRQNVGSVWRCHSDRASSIWRLKVEATTKWWTPVTYSTHFHCDGYTST